MAATAHASSSVNKPRHGRLFRLLHSEVFWVTLFVLFAHWFLLHWAINIYDPPFPPSWVGVKYFHFAVEDVQSETELVNSSASFNAVQSALIFFRPASPEAKELLPPLMVFNTFTLRDKEALRVTLADTVAQYLSGVAPNQRDKAKKILADPDAATQLSKVLVAVTESDNFKEADLQTEAKLKKFAKQISPESYDRVVDAMWLAPVLPPLANSVNTTTAGQLVTVSQPGLYRIIGSPAVAISPLNSAIRQPYDDFTTLNGKLIPMRGGRSAKLELQPGEYQLSEGAQLSPITYQLALHTLDGLPYVNRGTGHGWMSLSRKEEGIFHPLMTMSVFNSLDEDRAQQVDEALFTNIATFSNQWINHPHDWERTRRSLNRIPLSEGPSRTHVEQISTEQAKDFLLERNWYMPQYATQKNYQEYLTTAMQSARDPKTKIDIGLVMLHTTLEDSLNNTFWGVVQLWMNHTLGDVRYNGVTANCVAYATDLWNTTFTTKKYNPLFLGLIPAPSQLYRQMDPSSEQVIELEGEKS